MSKRKQGRQSKPPPPEDRPAAGAVVPPTRPGTGLPFAAAIFAGALLLFAVQPLIARYLLPWFGGGPGVWATCMLFFQALLLGGYLYAHLSVRFLPTRGQVVLHVALLTVALLLIPIIPAARWKPAGEDDPAWRILLLLAATIGLPYFVLSATSPLLQSWFVKVRPGVSPYRLFALSNLGSLLALVGYPTILEPFFTRQQQAWVWSAGLILFMLVCLACATQAWRRPPDPPAPERPDDEPLGRASATPAFLWLALPMVASVLLLATTNTLTEDVAVIPLLWVVPLALYLLTFVIAFDGPRWYPRRAMLVLLPLCTVWLIRVRSVQLLAPLIELDAVTLFEQFSAYLFAMFVVCLFCHGELAALKPSPRRLTTFYLMISLGGAMGGVFVALVAPRVFDRLVELPLAVLAAAGLGLLCLRHAGWWSRFARIGIGIFAVTALVLVACVPVLERALQSEAGRVVDRARNFYGTLVIAELDTAGRDNPASRARVMNHGTTSHGQQFLDPARRKETTLYYREGSGAALAIRHFPRQENLEVGLVGLGVGTLAAYGKPGDTFRFYEINPDVIRLARKHFTFLADSPARTDVILGDARLTLEREDPQALDVLVLDAFSGDAIPTHLLTAEAFALYRKHIKDDGVIAIHFSNRSVDLGPVLLRHAHHLGMSAVVADPSFGWWMLLTTNQAFLTTDAVRRQTMPLQPTDRLALWTDDYVNLLQAIRWIPKTTAKAR